MNKLEEKIGVHKTEKVLCPRCGERTLHEFQNGTTHLLGSQEIRHWTEAECTECGYSARQRRGKAGY